jgi:hypothetical protein
MSYALKMRLLTKLLFICLNLSGYLNTINCILYPLAVRLPLNGTPPDLGGSVWPKPVELESTLDYMTIDKDAFEIDLKNSLNECEQDIISKLWTRYRNILFPPKLAYQKPAFTDKRLKVLIFELNESNSRKVDIRNLDDCPKHYYPFIQDTETEACKLSKIM